MLLDAHSIIHRAYHALPDFLNSKGEPTGAIYGLLSMLIAIIKDLKPDYMVAAYDMPKETLRHKIFKDYKAGRKKADEDLKKQLQDSKKVLKTLAIETLSQQGYEADDILGSLAEKFKKKYDVIIASGDLDMLQLVDDKKVRVFTLKRSIKDTILYDEEAVKLRYGFGPDYVADYKALRGDPSDNIPGVKGVGEKTATELIKTFGHLEQIYSALEKDEKIFEQKGFRARVVKLLKDGKDDAFFSKNLALIVTSLKLDYEPEKKWKDAIDLSEALKMFYDLEFRTLAPRFEALFDHEKSEAEAQKECLDTSTMDFKETAIALWLLRSDITNPSPEDIFSFAGTKDFNLAKKIIFKTLKERKQEAVFYNIEKPLIPVVDKLNATGIAFDTAYMKKLSKIYHKRLDAIREEIIKLAGEDFNVNSPLQLSKILFEKLNITSSRLKKTSSGRFSTRESELEKIKNKHPIIEKILFYRELQKLLSTYIDNLPSLVKNGRLYTTFIQSGTSTGRLASQNPNLQNIPIKSDLGKAVRKAFVAPEGSFLASFDYSQIELKIAAILSGDKKLIEAFKNGADIHNAVAAEIFEVNPDKVDYEMRRKAKVINFGILYGMGVNALRLNLGNDISVKEAREFLNKYFEKYSGLAKWIDKTKAEASRKGYTETLFGRRRYFDGINSDIQYIRAHAERMAINAPIQGTQADIIKIAMRKIDDLLQRDKKDSSIKLVLQIHDELIYEVTQDDIGYAEESIKYVMENILDPVKSKGVPISVDFSFAKNWAEL